MFPAIIFFTSILQGQSQSTAQSQSIAKPVTFQRTYKVGEKSHYKVHATIETEFRQPASNLLTFLPQDSIIAYDYFTKVTKVEAGNATLRYYRPSIIETDDTGSAEGPVTVKVPLEVIMDLTVSPINEILDEKEVSSIKKPTPVTIPNPNEIMRPGLRQTAGALGIFGDLFSQLQQISALIGGPGSGIDLKPELSLEPLSVGSTWQKTVGYQPQQIGGGNKKTAIKRLDVTYTFKGLTTYKGKSYYEIDGEIHLNSDLTNYFRDQYHVTADQTHLKAIPMTLDSNLKFYLDPATKQTVLGTVDSSGGMSLTTTDNDQPLIELKIKSNSNLELVSKS